MKWLLKILGAEPKPDNTSIESIYVLEDGETLNIQYKNNGGTYTTTGCNIKKGMKATEAANILINMAIIIKEDKK